MTTILGDSINVSLPDSEDSLVVFLDISGQDPSVLLNKNPVLTYIITTKPLDDYKQLIDLGFFNIRYNVTPSKITQRYLINFLNTEYSANKISLIVESLVPIYKEYGNVANCIEALLGAIERADLETFETLVKFNLPTMRQAISKIDMMYSLAASLYEDKETIESLRASASAAESTAAEFTMYTSKIDELLIEVENRKQDLAQLTSQFQEAQQEIARLSTREVTVDVIKQHPAFIQLESQLRDTVATLSTVQDKYKKLQLATGVLNTPDCAGMDTKDKVIRQLKQDLLTATTTSWDQLTDKRIPAITDNITLAAEHILYIKEIRPTVYINGLVFWLNTYLNIKLTKERKKSFIILLFDPLHNQYTAGKYAKRGWAINNRPLANSNVVVTNDMSMEFLKGTLHIHEYDFIVVIDRLGLIKDVVSHKLAHRINLINTVNDITDYHLDPASCVGFWEMPANEQQPCKYVIKPSDPKLFVARQDLRSYKFASDGIWAQILKDTGVVENV